MANKLNIWEQIKDFVFNLFNPPVVINIKYFDDAVTKLEKIDKGDWIDLRSAIDVELSKDEFALIPLGVAMQLPRGYEAHAVPRSSTFKNFGVIMTNHMGVIDNSYRGNNDQWYFPAYALEDASIKKNDRICQFRIERKQPRIRFNTMAEFVDAKDRGGIGSTGVA